MSDGLAQPERASRRIPRGLLDALLCALLIYGVYAKTPLGAIGEWAVRSSLGQEFTASWFATFTGRETDVELEAKDLEKGVLASLSFPTSIEVASKRTRVDPELLATIVAVHGSCDGEICTVRAPRHLEALLERPTDDVAPVLDVAVALARGAKQLDGGPELAVEALFLPPHAVDRAVSQARATGLDAADDVEVHATFYAPSLRRGPLQKAVQVLALYRLRTLAWPTPPGKRTTSPYGYRVHPISGKRRFHNGTDVAVKTGTPLLSAHRGVVGRVSQDSISGRYVKVRHGFGIETTYCHMDETEVRSGQRVRRKEPLGKSGATGRVTGPHLHYILRIDGKAVDPEAYGEAPNRHRASDEPKVASGLTVTDDDKAEQTKPDKAKPVKSRRRRQRKPPAPPKPTTASATDPAEGAARASTPSSSPPETEAPVGDTADDKRAASRDAGAVEAPVDTDGARDGWTSNDDERMGDEPVDDARQGQDAGSS